MSRLGKGDRVSFPPCQASTSPLQIGGSPRARQQARFSYRAKAPASAVHGMFATAYPWPRFNGFVRKTGTDASSDTFRLAMPAPLLVIYLIQGIVREDPKDRSKDRPYRDGLVLPALAAHFPGVSDPDAPRRLVRYRLNRIAQDELLGADRDDDDDADDDPDD